MTNNSVLKRLRYIEGFSNTVLQSIFKEVGYVAALEDIEAWQAKEEDPTYKAMQDVELALFLNGLIQQKRGKKEGSPSVLETSLENNDIFKKVKIAYQLTSDDLLKIFQLSGKTVSKHEVSSFLRNPKQEKYCEMQDQYLRNFLSGLQKLLKGKPSKRLG